MVTANNFIVRRRLFFFLLMAAIIPLTILFSTVQASELQKDRSVVGIWNIVSILDYAPISVGESQAKPLVGQELVISPERIKFGNQECAESDFWAEMVQPDLDLRENARINNNKLRLPNPVTIVELSCAYAYIKNPDRIVLAWNGIFFDVVRKKNRKPNSNSRSKPADAP